MQSIFIYYLTFLLSKKIWINNFKYEIQIKYRDGLKSGKWGKKWQMIYICGK